MQIAVIETGGKQYKVSVGKKIKIDKVKAEDGKSFDFDRVLLVAGEKETKVGKPYLDGAKVSGAVLKQGRSKKVIVFKYKPKKRYRVKKGHRQEFTEVEIKKITS